jgi:lysophospholipase L1-like esterase
VGCARGPTGRTGRSDAYSPIQARRRTRRETRPSLRKVLSESPVGGGASVYSGRRSRRHGRGLRCGSREDHRLRALRCVLRLESPQRYYLAVGDSLTYGIQPAKVDAGLPPSKFNSGFVDVFARRLRTLNPKVQVVNYGCPGESTRTFVAGGCPWLAGGRALHNPFHGAQLDAALAFLRAHPNEVSPITLNLGGNDAEAFSAACKRSFACARARGPRAMTQIASRLESILRRLRLAAPKADVIVIGVWNNDITTARQSDPLYRAFDLVLQKAATSAGAHFADPFPLFDPPGSLTYRKARICAYTFMCSRGDGHPTDAGYRAIARAVLKASRYAQRS